MAAIRRICSRVNLDRSRPQSSRSGPTDEVVEAYTTELLAGRLLAPLTGDALAASCRLLAARLLDENHAPVGALTITSAGYLDCLVRVSRPDVTALVDVELWLDEHHLFTATSPPMQARTTNDVPHRRSHSGRLSQRTAVSGTFSSAGARLSRRRRRTDDHHRRTSRLSGSSTFNASSPCGTNGPAPAKGSSALA
jgi:hypothetical protein